MEWARVFAGDRLLVCYLEHVAASIVVRISCCFLGICQR